MNLAAVIARAEETLRLADSVTLESTEGQYAQAVVQLRDVILRSPHTQFCDIVCGPFLDGFNAGHRAYLCNCWKAIALSPAPKEGE